MFASVNVILSVVVSVCDAVSRFAPPLRVRVRSVKLKPDTGSLKTIVIDPTPALRGSGTTSTISTVGPPASKFSRPGDPRGAWKLQWAASFPYEYGRNVASDGTFAVGAV